MVETASPARQNSPRTIALHCADPHHHHPRAPVRTRAPMASHCISTASAPAPPTSASATQWPILQCTAPAPTPAPPTSASPCKRAHGIALHQHRTSTRITHQYQRRIREPMAPRCISASIRISTTHQHQPVHEGLWHRIVSAPRQHQHHHQHPPVQERLRYRTASAQAPAPVPPTSTDAAHAMRRHYTASAPAPAPLTSTSPPTIS